MSQRSCNYINGDGTFCSAVCHSTVRVGVPGHGPVRVTLCFAHRNTSDPMLLILARAKLIRQQEPAPIRSRDIVKGTVVQRTEDESLATIALVTDKSVRLEFTSGGSAGCSRNELKKYYRLAGRLKHQQPS